MLNVSTQKSGSYLVVFVTPNFYLDARKDVRAPDFTFIEVVRHGHVRHRKCVPNRDAPGLILRIVKEYMIPKL